MPEWQRFERRSKSAILEETKISTVALAGPEMRARHTQPVNRHINIQMRKHLGPGIARRDVI